MYAFVDAFHKSKKENEVFKKGDWFFQKESMQDFKSQTLDALKSFYWRYFHKFLIILSNKLLAKRFHTENNSLSFKDLSTINTI